MSFWWRSPLWRSIAGDYSLYVADPTDLPGGCHQPVDQLQLDYLWLAGALVVLGRVGPLRMSRVETAVELWRTQRAPMIVASGREDAWPIKNALTAAKVPGRRRLIDPCSRTTYESAQETASLLLPQGKQRIILVSDLPRLLRSHLTFETLGFQVIPHASPLPDHLPWPRRHLLTVRECLGWLSYGIRGRYAQKTAPSAGPTSHQVQQGHAHGHPTGHLLRDQT
ncbi:hypothetical protein XM38_031860 [Halomicronema hongdechloris C2206]|uniref:DUF218 domain-containing protein n=1 Tax=Halomicronema hongdechloris C2206 TaxID=1641165 RepID=A0A1Z3HPK2_9CYAN|nr:YdcF family protein [Halomicronema hongdechloris]ASC72231.1 hypothetical protein XM38_031860 [Halomicronema hongdechloris C2206]